MKTFRGLLARDGMTLIVSLPRNEAALMRAAFQEGADAVKVHANVAHRASGNRFGTLDECLPAFEEMFARAEGPLGLVPGASVESVERDLPAAAALPFDFFSMYAHHAPAAALSVPQALMLAAAHGCAPWEAEGFRAAGAHILEASIVNGEEYGRRLSLRDAIAYRALAARAGLPVVVPTQLAIRPEEVCTLRDAGVKGLMIGAIVTGDGELSIARATARFRRAIDQLS